MLKKYADYVLSNNKEMPNPISDAERFSDLHSWYKHLGEFTIAYPILLKGEEIRYSFDPDLTDDNQNKFHWRFVLEDNLNSYKMELGDNNYINIPEEIKDFMKKYPIYLDKEFNNSSEIGKYQIKTCNYVAEMFWNELIKI